MGVWIVQNLFNVISATGVLAGLWFTVDSIRSESKTLRIANLLTITKNHRDIWSGFTQRPDLARVLESFADLENQRITRNEEVFVNTVILHANSVYYAVKDDLMVNLEGLRRDLSWFFSLPIPKAIWAKTKFLQNEEFVAFVDECLNQK